MDKTLHIAFLFLASLLAACSPDGRNINTVKDGTMSGYEKTTIGKAFEASFDQPKWEYLETEKGVGIVQFSGAISNQLHNDAVAKIEALRNDPSFINNPYPQYGYWQLFNSAFRGMVAVPYAYGSTSSTGEDNLFIESLNRELGCTGAIFVGTQARTKCPDDKTSLDYANKIINEWLRNYVWPVGSEVKVQWAINTDGRTFELYVLESNAWVGMEANNILQTIYK